MQPGITDLFGANSTFSGTPKVLEIPLNSLPALTSANPTALELYAAIIQTAHTWLNANTDASVLATSDITISSPITRNGTPKTPAILILKKNQIKFSCLNRELVSNHHFLTNNYYPTPEVDRFLKICPLKIDFNS